MLIERWITRIWPVQRHNATLRMLLLWAPFIPLIVLLLIWGIWKNPAARESIRVGWSLMSPIERVLRMLAIIWFLGFVLLMLINGPRLMRWGFNLWFPIPAVFLIMIVGQLVLMAGIAFSVRRR